jgi:sugar lactone lactonase YvrE
MTDTIMRTEAHRLADGFTFLEGPRWHDGALYASDFYSERILKFSDTGAVERVCSVQGRPSGLGFPPDGGLWVVSMLNREVKLWDGEQVNTVASFGHLIDGYANDMIVTPDGWALVGNFGNTDARPDSLVPTGLVRISPSGEVDMVGSDLIFPNGMVITPDQRELVIAETFAGRLTAYELSVGQDGRPELGVGRTYKQFGVAPDYVNIDRATAELEFHPDGLAIDEGGAIWVASSTSHFAVRIAPNGSVLEYVDVGDLCVYAVALGGADGKTLFLCCSPGLGVSDPTTTTESVLMAAHVTVAAAVYKEG